jgi:hypothetical protein
MSAMAVSSSYAYSSHPVIDCTCHTNASKARPARLQDP